MMRRIAVVGDKLNNDGEICSYSGMTLTVGDAGRQAALINRTAYCPVCKTTGCIAKEGGPRRMTLGASEIALDRDVVVCNCAEHPHITAKLSGEAWYDDLAESLGTIGSSKFESVGSPSCGAATTASPARRVPPGFDELIVLRDEDGHPIANQRFRIRSADGEVYEGTTNETGETVRVRTVASIQLEIEMLV